MHLTESKWIAPIFSIIEGGIVLFTILAFWHHAPPIRDNWVWLLWLAVPVFFVRYHLWGRLWTDTPMQVWMVLFVLLSYFSFTHAPYARADFVVLICRPLVGMWFYIYACEQVRIFKSMWGLLVMTIGMASVVAWLGLSATHWEIGKSAPFQALIDILPRFDYRQLAQTWNHTVCLPFSQVVIGQPCFQTGDVIGNLQFGFNPNEIAGALAWVVPVMGAIAFLNHRNERHWIALRVSAGLVCLVGMMALFIGQSRFAIFGVLVAFIVMAFIGISQRRTKVIVLGVVGSLFLFEASLLLNLFTPSVVSVPTTGLSERDERTFTTRFEIWDRGLQMMVAYPTTGIGIYMFRTATGVAPYTIPYYVEKNTTPPHAHNEWIHVGAEMGILGLVIFVAWQVGACWMLWQGWKSNNPEVRMVCLATSGALLAHAFYGMGDAITLWDRYQFVLWWIYALAGAVYVYQHYNIPLADLNETITTTQSN